MDDKFKKLWIEALLSGEYQQTTGYLTKEGKYCCLGVLCEVAINNGINIDKQPDKYTQPEKNIFVYNEGAATLPDELVTRFDILEKNLDDLMNMNDNGKSFIEIAKWIGEYL